MVQHFGKIAWQDVARERISLPVPKGSVFGYLDSEFEFKPNHLC